jgi:hypothetical protein
LRRLVNGCTLRMECGRHQRADVLALEEFDGQVEVEIVGPTGDLAIIAHDESEPPLRIGVVTDQLLLARTRR